MKKFYLSDSNLMTLNFVSNNSILFINKHNNKNFLLNLYNLIFIDNYNLNFNKIVTNKRFNLIFYKQRIFNLFVKFIKKLLVDILRGYCLILNVIGLGFTITIWKGDQLRFNIGYNHLIYYRIPLNIMIKSRSRRNIFLFSNSYFILKKVAVEIKNFRKLSIYKLKGIKEKNELYVKKAWKKKGS